MPASKASRESLLSLISPLSRQGTGSLRELFSASALQVGLVSLAAQGSKIIPRDHPAVTLATDSIQQMLGYSPEFKVESGRTNSSYFNEAGIKTVIIGPGEVAHIADECVNIERLDEFTQTLYHMLSREN